MNYPSERNYGCRLTTNCVLHGLRTVVMENQKLRVTLLVDKGTDIWEFLYKPLDVDFMWRSPMGLREGCGFTPTSSGRFGLWYDYYEGGWQEILPSGGLPSSYKGADYGLHGESSLIPWQFRVLEDRPERVAVAFWTRFVRSPFYVEKKISLEAGSAALVLEETVENEAREPMALMWGHHPALGAAFLEEGCTIDTGATRVQVPDERMFDHQRMLPGASFSWPVGLGSSGGVVDLSHVPSSADNSADFALLEGFEHGWYAVTNPSLGVGFGMAWPAEVFPFLWLWQVCGGSYEYPWYGRTYNLALEPFTSLPGGIEAAVRSGTARVLAPGEQVSARLCAAAYAGRGRVRRLHPDGRVEWAGPVNGKGGDP